MEYSDLLEVTLRAWDGEPRQQRLAKRFLDDLSMRFAVPYFAEVHPESNGYHVPSILTPLSRLVVMTPAVPTDSLSATLTYEGPVREEVLEELLTLANSPDAPASRNGFQTAVALRDDDFEMAQRYVEFLVQLNDYVRFIAK